MSAGANNGEVRIPVILDVQSEGLQKLKSEVERVTDAANKASKKGGRGSMLSFEKETIKNYVAELSYLEGKIVELERTSLKLSMRNFNTDLDQATKKAEELGKAVKEAEKGRASAQGKYGVAVREAIKAEDYVDKAYQKIAEIENLAKEAGRELSEQEKDTIRNLETEIKLRQNFASQRLDTALGSYNARKSDVENYKSQYEYASAAQKVLSEIAGDEQRIAAYEENLTEQTKATNAELDGTVERYKEVARLILQVLKNNNVSTSGINESLLGSNDGKEQKATTIETLSDAEKRLAHNTQESAKAAEKEVESNKASTAQFYYKLRAVKMLGFVINQANTTVTNFGKTTLKVTSKMLSAYLRLIPGVSTLRKAISGATKEQKKFNAESKKAVKTNGLMNMSFKDLVKNVLKYGLGIRSIYVLFNKLRKAVISGLGEMSQMFDDVNTSMSSIVTSFAQLKAALTSIIEPLVHVLAPILEKISALFTELSYKAASFIAALTGQSMVYKATRSQIDYAKSLDKTAKSAKEARKELGAYDKLNVIHKDNNDDDDQTGMAWEKVPIDATMKGWADKFKKFLDDLFAPIKAAWEKWGAWVKASFKKMLDELLGLGKAIADDFWKVWQEPETQKIFENIFHILGDMALIVANLAINFRNAWKHNDNGYRTLKAIRDIILVITDSLVRMADYTVEWSRNLDFTPLLDAVADTLEQKIVPAVEKIMGLFETLYEQIFLNIVKKFIEGGLPRLVELFGKVVEIVGIIADKINFALKSGSNGINTVNKISELLDIVADHIDSALDKTKEWAEQLDFRKLFQSFNGYLDSLKPAIETISSILENLWTNVLLPFWEYLIEQGFPKLFDKLSELNNNLTESGGWEKITENVNNFLAGLEPLFELSWDVLVEMINDIAEAFTNFLQSDNFGDFAQKFKDFFETLREDEDAPARIAEKIEHLIDVFVKVVVQLQILAKFIMPVITGFMTLANTINMMGIGKSLSTLTSVIGNGAAGGGLTGAFSSLAGILPTVAVVIGIVVAAIGLMVAAFGGVGETIAEIKERFDNVKQSLAEFAEQIGFSDTIDKLKEAFSRMGDSAQNLRPIFEFLLDIIAELVKVVGKTLIGALDGIIPIITGVIDIFSGLFDIIGAVVDFIIATFSGDEAGVNAALTEFEEGVGKVFWGISEVVEGVFLGITEALAGFIDEVLPGISQGVTDFCNSVKEGFEWLKNVLIGDPIVYDIEDGVEEGFSGFVKNTLETVTGWVKDVKDKFNDLKEKIGEKVSAAKDAVVTKFSEMKDGLKEKADAAKEKTLERFGALKDGISKLINKDTLEDAGTEFIEGFDDAEAKQWSVMMKQMMVSMENLIKQFNAKLNATTLQKTGDNMVSGLTKAETKGMNSLNRTANTQIKNLISVFDKGFNPNTFFDIAVNAMNAMARGFVNTLMSVKDTVRNVCQDIIDSVINIFEIGSPSKVFTNIGNMLGAGLEKSGFINSFSELKDEAVEIAETMVDDMNDTLSDFNFMSNMNNQLAMLNSIKIPDIVSKGVLPSNIKFSQSNTAFDNSKLPELIQDAISSILNSNNSSNNVPIVLQLDGRIVAEAVWDEEEKRYKQRGEFSPIYS